MGSGTDVAVDSAVGSAVGSAVTVGVTVASLPVVGDTTGSEPLNPESTVGETEGVGTPPGLSDIIEKVDEELNSTFFETKYCPV